jgi:hypothetical protein
MSLSEVFFTFLITSIIGCILAIAKLSYKSKCIEIDLCCLKIIRDTSTEGQIDEMAGNNDDEKKDDQI